MDGVLVDSEPLHLRAFQELMQGFGISFTAEDNHEFLGRTDRYVCETMATRHGLAISWESLVEQKEAVLSTLLKAEAKAQPGVMKLLQDANLRGIPMAVASSATAQTIELVVDTLGIRQYFQCLCSGEEVEHGKPAPDIFLLAARRLNVAPGDCLVIEDTFNGLRAALAAGMRCIAIPCDATRHQDHSMADRVLSTMDELQLSDWFDTQKR